MAVVQTPEDVAPPMAASASIALHNALDAFSRGDVEEAQAILDTAAETEAATRDVEDLFAVCCMRASLAAMRGMSNIADLMHRAAGSPRQAAVTSYLEGLSALARSSLQTARIQFEEARRRDRHFVLARVGLAAVYFQWKKYKECFAEYREVLGALGSHAVPSIVRVGMGLCAYHLQRLPFAQQILERALEVNPDDELALLGLLVVYLDRRLLPKVTETVLHLRRLLPCNAMVLLKVGDLMYFKAIAPRRLQASRAAITQLLGEVRRLGSPEECAMADFQEGRLCLAGGDLSRAGGLLESALRTLPGLLAARVHYARLLLFSGKEEDAVPLLRKLHQEHPNTKEVLQLLAACATRRGQHEAALRYCHRLTESVAQGDVQSWSLAAWCSRLDPEEGKRLLAHVVGIHRRLGRAPPWQLLANWAVLSKDVEALQSIVDAQIGGDLLGQPSLEVRWVPLVFNLALLLEQNDRTRARQLYVFLVKRQSTFKLPYFRLHALARAEGHVEQAIAWLTLLRQLIPEEATALAFIGQTFFEQQRYMVALRVLRSTTSKALPVALALGATYLWCSQQHGKDNYRFLSNAKDRFLFVLRADKGNILAAHGLACCLGLEGDYDHCQSMLDRVGEVQPSCLYVRKHHDAHMANVKTLSDSYKQAIDYLFREPQRTAGQNSSLAFCFACVGRYEEAIETLSEVAEEHQDQPMLLYNLSLLHCAAFIRRVSQADALTLEEGRKLRTLLERGLSLASRFVQLEPTSHVMSIGRLFLKSVSTYCCHTYEVSVNRLIAVGKENDAEQTRESLRWARAFEEYRTELKQEEEQRDVLETQRREERENAGREVLTAFQSRRQANPVMISDQELIAANLADLMEEEEGAVGEAAAPAVETTDTLLAGMEWGVPLALEMGKT